MQADRPAGYEKWGETGRGSGGSVATGEDMRAEEGTGGHRRGVGRDRTGGTPREGTSLAVAWGQEGTRCGVKAAGSDGTGVAARTLLVKERAWRGKVRRSSAAGKPTAALVGVADKKANVAQPLDPRAKVGRELNRRNGCR
jgi:hypothetical protein